LRIGDPNPSLEPGNREWEPFLGTPLSSSLNLSGYGACKRTLFAASPALSEPAPVSFLAGKIMEANVSMISSG